MFIERNFSKFVVFSEDTVVNALNKINENKCRLIFAVSESGILEGVLTDGDLRRWLTTIDEISLNVPVSVVMNREFLHLSIDEKPDVIFSILDKKITAIPLLDDNFRLVAVALSQSKGIEINGFQISDVSPTYVIAEIGNNHNGSLDLAKRLVDEAVKAGADCAKFQMRSMGDLYGSMPADGDDSADLGAQYTLDLLSKFQLSDEDLFRVFDYCKEKDITPLCTPWDVVSLEKLEKYGMQGYKVASADFTNFDFISALAETGKPLICSTGMSSEREIIGSIEYIKKCGASIILLHCNSTYPAPFKDINLNYMKHLQKLGGCLVGYSGHERGIFVAVAAVSLGAKVVEKHFTLDRSMEGNDHKVSLLPSEFALMIQGIRQVEESLGTSEERKLSQGEMMNRENLAKSLVAAVGIKPGMVVTDDMIVIRSPGQGLQPNRKSELIGKTLKVEKQIGDCFFPSDLGEEIGVARDYTFDQQWGVPVRYHDLQKTLAESNMNILEIHLSYKDMEVDFKKYISQPLDVGLVVHSPELFSGDHTLDLCSSDDEYRRRSVFEMQRVINLTRELSAYFNNKEPVCIVTNVGGFSHDGHIHHEKRSMLYTTLEQSLRELNMDGVEVIPQTMPPFPWHFGGQQFHNLFVDADGIVDFCFRNKIRVCLDSSHSKLSCNHGKWSFSEFVKKVGPYTAHLHIADAVGVDGEGIQIGDGDIDWLSFWNIVRKYAPNATFIPEIWQGHKNGGEGAWLALSRLERFSIGAAD